MGRYELQLAFRDHPSFQRTHRRFIFRYRAMKLAKRLIRSTVQFQVFVYDRRNQEFLLEHR